MKRPEHAHDRCYCIYDQTDRQRCSQVIGHEGACGTDWEWCDEYNEGACLM